MNFDEFAFWFYLACVLGQMLGADANCIDANVRYRLMRIADVQPIFDRIPADFFHAAVALAVPLRRANTWRHGSIPSSSARDTAAKQASAWATSAKQCYNSSIKRNAPDQILYQTAELVDDRASEVMSATSWSPKHKAIDSRNK
jgi:hypothetical protein